MRCAQCGWPTDEAKVLSTHRTSEGWVRYRQCIYGTVAIELITLGSTVDDTPVRASDAREQALTG